MSGYAQATIICDGPLFQVPCEAHGQGDTSLTGLRESLRRAGWTRRHHVHRGDARLIDLCPSCTAVVRVRPPIFRGGRPRKVRA